MTMTRFRVLPYRQGSASAKALAEALGGKVLKLEGSKFKPKPDDVVVNWGYTGGAPLNLVGHEFVGFNGYPDILKRATNKLLFFKKIAEVKPEIIPRFWTNKNDIPPDAFPIVCRTVLAGHSGAGIVISSDPASLVQASLYVQYKKKKDEYRVHCGKNVQTPLPGAESGGSLSDGVHQTTIIAIQRKAKRNGAENVDWQIRNHANGFIYRRDNINPPPCVETVARSAFELSGLDFGAVDVIFNQKEGKAYVLEINTAPGLEGQTITDYSNYFKGVVG